MRKECRDIILIVKRLIFGFYYIVYMKKDILDMEEQEFYDVIEETMKSIDCIIKDPVDKINWVSKMLQIEDKFEYFGDKFLNMDDFWGSLTPDNRLALLGNLMNNNTMHFYYGKYNEIMISLAAMVRMHEINMEKFKQDYEKEILNPRPTLERPAYMQ